MKYVATRADSYLGRVAPTKFKISVWPNLVHRSWPSYVAPRWTRSPDGRSADPRSDPWLYTRTTL